MGWHQSSLTPGREKDVSLHSPLPPPHTHTHTHTHMHTHTHTWLAPLVENGSDVKGSWPLNGSVTAEEEAVEGCAGLPPGATAVGVPNGSFLNRSSLIPG